jgi:carboxyl-terminal processing protease
MGDVLQRMRGPVGAPVLLTLRHRKESDPFQVRIRRAAIPLDSIKGHFKDRSAKWRFRLPENERLAHVRITAFADRTLVELVTVLTELQQLGVKGVVLDLRDNAGGDLETAVAVSDLFLAAGQTIVTIKDRFENVRQQYVASEDGPFDTLPLAVLIDRNSASASEILAACLQDNGRAVVIGDRSFGKGTVQHLIDIGPPVALRGSEQPPVLKLTSASYWRPSGKNIHRKGGTYKRDDEADWGVHPTAGFEVSLSDDEYKRYKLDRLTRDAYNPNGNALPPVEGESEEPFLDRALGMAVADLEEKSNK